VSSSDSKADGPVILSEITGRIGIITLNRPERRNALNGALIEALDEAVLAMAGNPEAKVVILTGAAPQGGHGGFCSGGDVKDGGLRRPDGDDRPMGARPGSTEADLDRFDLHAPMLLHTMPKPTIAMIGGPAVGAGLSLAGACDLRYAAEDAVFASNFSANGLSGDYGGTLFWTRIIGTARTRELYYLNDKISAWQALAWGMVNDVFAPAELRDRVLAVAERLLRTPASLLARVKDNLTEAEEAADRRRWLFANETRNQREAVAEIARRMRERARKADRDA
jgi:2-(1,2-epoxy-1,2-dihydrophenyl)acetyl-CoA isomerase